MKRMKINLLMILGGVWTAIPVAGATFTADGSQEIGGVAPQVVGVAAVTNTASGGAWVEDTPNHWTFTFSAYDSVPLNGAILTYTRNSDTSTSPTTYYDRGTNTFDLGGASLGGTTDAGIIRMMSVRNMTGTGTTEGRNYRNDHILITNVSDIGIGGLETHDDSTSGTKYAYGGHIQIGMPSAPAGQVRIANIRAHSGGASYNGCAGGAGAVWIHSSGTVRIEDGAGTRGAISTHLSRQASSGNITVTNIGAFSAGTLHSHLYGGNTGGASQPGHIRLDGGNSSGSCSVDSILAGRSQTNSYSGTTRSQVIISRYASVSIGTIDTSSLGTNTKRVGGDVIITNGITGDIDIRGPINLRAYHSTTNWSGSMWLSAGGTVTLAELDLDKVLALSISTGLGSSSITGVLTNFNTTATGGVGAADSPYVTTQTVLRLPAGQRLYYSMATGGNSDLGGYVYRVADSEGTAGLGGLLMTRPVAVGTVFRFQ